MKLFRLLAAALLALVVSLVSVGAAQAYPSPVFNLSLNRHTVYGGQTVQATVKSNVECSTWKVDFLGQTATGHNTDTFTHTFATQKVTKKQLRDVTARCTYDSAAVGAGHAVRIVAAESGLLHSPVTILPRKATGTGQVGGNGNGHHNGSGTSGGSGSGLPNTGGPAFWVALLALVLVLGGGVAMVRNRRHAAAGAPPAGGSVE